VWDHYRHDTLISSVTREYHKNGKLKTFDSMYCDPRHLRPAPFIPARSPLFFISFEVDYSQLKSSGRYTEYYSNGNKKKDCEVKNDLYDGILREYYENGVLKSEEVYKEDMCTGLAKEFYDNGQLKREGVYRNDYPEGTHKHYSRDGQLIKTEEFKDGVKQK
jgi:antitoxin component YwqK of YwqJK toxin-antitoxin module